MLKLKVPVKALLNAGEKKSAAQDPLQQDPSRPLKILKLNTPIETPPKPPINNLHSMSSIIKSPRSYQGPRMYPGSNVLLKPYTKISDVAWYPATRLTRIWSTTWDEAWRPDVILLNDSKKGSVSSRGRRRISSQQSTISRQRSAHSIRNSVRKSARKTPIKILSSVSKFYPRHTNFTWMSWKGMSRNMRRRDMQIMNAFLDTSIPMKMGRHRKAC